MFYDIFKQLCDRDGITPTKASKEIGFSKGSVSYWKKKYLQGIDVKPDSYTAEKIADYFNVSVDYLLGRTDDPIDYDDPELIASIPLSYMEACDYDTRRAYAMQQAVDEDAQREFSTHRPFDLQLFSDDSMQRRLLAFFNVLNDLGRSEALKRVQELSEIPRYRDTPPESKSSEE